MRVLFTGKLINDIKNLAHKIWNSGIRDISVSSPAGRQKQNLPGSDIDHILKNIRVRDHTSCTTLEKCTLYSLRPSGHHRDTLTRASCVATLTPITGEHLVGFVDMQTTTTGHLKNGWHFRIKWQLLKSGRLWSCAVVIRHIAKAPNIFTSDRQRR